MEPEEQRPGEPGVATMLGPLATAVMRVLWDRGPSSVADVVAHINREQPRQLAYTTVMTILVRLHDRGLVERTKVGRGYVYRPAGDEPASVDALAGQAVDAVLARYGSAAVRQFGERLGELDPELRAELVRLAGGGPP